jgi:colanic acid/amylovoran biosynthesis glycosyltransferase
VKLMPGRRRLLVLASTFPVSSRDPTPAFVRDLALEEARAYETTVLVPAVPGAPATEALGAMRVRRFRFFPRRWEDLADGAILENLRTRKSRWLQVPPFFVAEVLAVRREVRRTRPDVIHAHWILPQGLAARMAAPSVPLIVTTHGGDLYGLPGRWSRRLIRAVLRRADAVTAMNLDMRDRLIALGSPAERTFVLPMGADVNAVRESGRQVEQVAGRVLFVGRLVEKKGLSILLQASRDLSVEHELVVVGDGPLRAELVRQADGSAVTFLGSLSRSAVAEEYARAEVVVFPSVPASSGDQDGLPVALVEAMAAGRAVIASNLPGLREAVVPDSCGMLVPPGDPVALRDAISALLRDESRRTRLGAGARARADEYSINAVGRRYRALLHTVVEGSAQSSPARR